MLVANWKKNLLVIFTFLNKSWGVFNLLNDPDNPTCIYRYTPIHTGIYGKDRSPTHIKRPTNDAEFEGNDPENAMANLGPRDFHVIISPAREKYCWRLFYI